MAKCEALTGSVVKELSTPWCVCGGVVSIARLLIAGPTVCSKTRRPEKPLLINFFFCLVLSCHQSTISLDMEYSMIDGI